jgi:hypothetical protein
MKVIFAFLFVISFLAAPKASAQTKTVVYYQVGKSSAVTDVAGPETLSGSASKGPILTESGNPLFFASAPELPGHKVQYSISAIEY